MYRYICLGVTLLLSVFILTSCGGGASEPAPAPEQRQSEPEVVPLPEISADQFKLAEDMLAEVNKYREAGVTCTNSKGIAKNMPPVPVLSLNEYLIAAAIAHSKDMAQSNNMNHVGSDGKDYADRVEDVGYTPSWVAENIAFTTDFDIDFVVQRWVDSTTGHCVNLMSPLFTELGAAVERSLTEQKYYYWTQVFAAPGS